MTISNDCSLFVSHKESRGLSAIAELRVMTIVRTVRMRRDMGNIVRMGMGMILWYGGRKLRWWGYFILP